MNAHLQFKMKNKQHEVMTYNLMTSIRFIEEKDTISTNEKLQKFTLKNALPSITIENNL